MSNLNWPCDGYLLLLLELVAINLVLLSLSRLYCFQSCLEHGLVSVHDLVLVGMLDHSDNHLRSNEVLVDQLHVLSVNEVAELNIFRKQDDIVILVEQEHSNQIGLSFNKNPCFAPICNIQLLLKRSNLSLTIDKLFVGNARCDVCKLEMESERLNNIDVSFSSVILESLIDHLNPSSSWLRLGFKQTILSDLSEALSLFLEGPLVL